MVEIGNWLFEVVKVYETGRLDLVSSWAGRDEARRALGQIVNGACVPDLVAVIMRKVPMGMVAYSPIRKDGG